jgi:putative FmdB family regulatory protein
MPTYEYRCDKCRHEFTVILTVSEHGSKRISCPKCKGRKLTQQISGFHPITSKKS